MTKHVHSELIKQWADDTRRVVQVLSVNKDGWIDCVPEPTWMPDREYRFKPDPKVEAYEFKAERFMGKSEVRIPEHWELPNLRLTFEDGKLIKAEVI